MRHRENSVRPGRTVCPPVGLPRRHCKDMVIHHPCNVINAINLYFLILRLMLRQAHYPRMVFRISRTTTVRRSPLPDVVADAYAHVPPGGVVCTGLRRAAVRISGGNCLQSAIRTPPCGSAARPSVCQVCRCRACRDAYLRLIVVVGGLWSRRWRSVVVETRLIASLQSFGRVSAPRVCQCVKVLCGASVTCGCALPA